MYHLDAAVVRKGSDDRRLSRWEQHVQRSLGSRVGQIHLISTCVRPTLHAEATLICPTTLLGSVIASPSPPPPQGHRDGGESPEENMPCDGGRGNVATCVYNKYKLSAQE
jgi:hypothetical protein